MKNTQFRITIILALLFGLIFAFLLLHRRNEFEHLELLAKIRQQELIQILDVSVQMQSDPLKMYSFDYTYWDDMVEYARSRDSVWAQQNLVESMSNYKTDLIWVFSKVGQLIFHRKALADTVSDYSNIIDLEHPRLFQDGYFPHLFLVRYGQLIEIFIAPIQPTADNERVTEPQGFFAVGRIWSEASLSKFAEHCNSKLQLHVGDEVGKHTAHTSTAYEQIAFDKAFYSLDGEKLAILHANYTSTTIQEYYQAVNRQILFYTIFGIIVILFIAGLLLLWVSQPLNKLTQALSQSYPQKVEKLTRQRTEFGELARLIVNFFQQRDELRASQEMLATLFANLPGMAYRAVFGEKDRVIRQVSAGCYNITGYTIDEMVDNRMVNYGSLIHTEDIQRIQSEVRTALEQHKSFNINYRIAARDGKEKWIWEQGGGLYNASGAVHNVIGFISDITEQRRAQAALVESEERYRTLVDNMPIGIYRTTPDGRILAANPALIKILGLNSIDELASRNLEAEGFEPSYRRAEFKATIESEGAVVGLESIWRREDGTRTFIRENAHLVRDEHGKPLYYEGTVEDVTVVKRAEAAVRESEELFRSIVNQSSDAIFLMEMQRLKIFKCNPMMEQMLQMNAVELVNIALTDITDAPHYGLTDLQRRFEIHNAIFMPECRWKRSDGSWLDIELSLQKIRLGDDDAIVGFARDITIVKEAEIERRLAEASIRAAQERYQAFIQNSAEGIWRYEFEEPLPLNLSEAELIDAFLSNAYMAECNDACARMYGYQSAGDMIGMRVSEFIPRLSLSYFQPFLDAIANQVWQVNNYESQEIDQQGKYHLFTNNITGIIENGKVIRLWGTQTDITEKKAQEKQLQRMTRLYALLSQINQAIVHSNNPQELMTALCRAAIEYGQFKMAWVLEMDETGGLRVTASAGSETETTLQAIALKYHNRKNLPPHAVIESGKYAVTNDLLNDPLLSEFKPLIEQAGVRSRIAIPIIFKGQARGTFSVSSDEVDFFQVEELKLFQEIESNITFALENFEREELRRQSETALRESERKLKEAQKLGRIGHWEYDIESGQIEWSDTVYEIYGRDPALGPPTAEEEATFYSLEDSMMLKAYAAEAIRRGSPWMTDVRIELPDGSHKRLTASGTPLRNDEGKVVQLHGTVQDITERKLAEEETARSEELLRTILEALPVGVWILNENGAIIHGNPAADRIWAGSRYVGIDRYGEYKAWRVSTGERIEAGQWAAARAIKSGEAVYNEEIEIESFDGTHKFILNSAIPLRDSKGKTIGAVVVNADVTQIKQAEQAARYAHDRAQQYLDVAGELIVRLDSRGDIALINKSGCKLLGYDNEQELLGRNWFDQCLPEENRPQVAKTFFDSLAAKQDFPLLYENPVLTRSGEIRQILWHNATLRDKEGRITGTLSSGQDITEWKAAQEALSHSESTLKAILKAAPIGVGMVNDKREFTWLSDYFLSMLGYKMEELIEKSAAILYYDEDEFLRVGAEIYSQIEQSGIGEVEARGRCKDGQIIDVLLRASYLVPNDRAYGAIFTILDITARKRIENALRQREIELRRLFDEDLTGDYITTVEGKIKLCNPAFARIFGYDSVEEAAGDSAHNLYFSEADRRKFISELAEKGRLQEYESRMRRRDGEEIFILGNCIALRDEEGALKELQGYIFDITDRKRAEQERRESERRYRLLVENAFDAIYLLREKRYEYVNPRFCEIVGYTYEELTAPDFDYNVFLTSRSKELIEQRYQARKAGSAVPSQYTLELKSKDGRCVFVEVSTVSIGTPSEIAVLGIMRDVTERIHSQEKLLASERRYREVVEGASECIMTTDMNGYFLFANAQTERISGYSVEELQQKKYTDLVLPEYLARVKRFYIRQYLSRTPSAYLEFPFRSKSGRIVWFGQNATLIIENDKVVGFHLVSRDITELKIAEEARWESEAQYRTLIEQSNDAIYLICDGKFEIINRRFAQMFNVTSEDVRAPDFDFNTLVAPESRELIAKRIEIIKHGEEPPSRYEFTALAKDGRRLEVEVSVTQLTYKGRPATQGILRDITDRNQLEAQLRQSQKLKAIGQLAGGIAHDFNNILMAISGSSDLLAEQLPPDEIYQSEVRQIQASTARCAALTRQLLTFARNQSLDMQRVDVNLMLSQLEPMLLRLIGRRIPIKLNLAGALPPVIADRNQLELAVINLVLNSSDATDDTGVVTIESKRCYLDEAYIAMHPEVKPGDYVCLSVSDNGEGMSKEVLERACEPFFTTKPIGKGTGLGLATVHGIVKQMNGHLSIYSEQGAGATVELYLPSSEGKLIKTKAEKKMTVRSRKGSETVLLADDEEAVRLSLAKILTLHGYTVLQATDGLAGLAAAEKHSGPIDILVTDLVMPRMGGVELAEKLKQKYPALKVMYMSGYTPDANNHEVSKSIDSPFISKPFHSPELIKKMREVLDAP